MKKRYIGKKPTFCINCSVLNAGNFRQFRLKGFPSKGIFCFHRELSSQRELLFRMSGGVVLAVLIEVYCPVANLDVLRALRDIGVGECRVSI